MGRTRAGSGGCRFVVTRCRKSASSIAGTNVTSSESPCDVTMKTAMSTAATTHEPIAVRRVRDATGCRTVHLLREVSIGSLLAMQAVGERASEKAQHRPGDGRWRRARLLQKPAQGGRLHDSEGER